MYWEDNDANPFEAARHGSGKWVGQNNDVIMEYNDVYIMCIGES